MKFELLNPKLKTLNNLKKEEAQNPKRTLEPGNPGSAFWKFGFWDLFRV